jgi:hypothetical protein
MKSNNPVWGPSAYLAELERKRDVLLAEMGPAQRSVMVNMPDLTREEINRMFGEARLLARCLHTP